MKPLAFILMKFTRIFFLLCFTASLWACDPDKKDDKKDISFDQAAFLNNLSSQIILPAYANLKVKTNELSNSIDTLVAHKNNSNLKNTQTKLKATYLAWQKVSFLRFGPDMAIGLGANVNTFPTDTAAIENNIFQNNTQMDLLSMDNKKGLPALDYLLQHLNDSSILAELDNNRVQYLNAVVLDLKTKIETVANKWTTSYKADFNSSLGTDVGSATGQLINALNLHFERFFRDGKIGIPIGVRSSGIHRSEDAEAFYGGYSVALAQANFKAMVEFYNGKDGLGLDDYLIASDASSLNQTIQTQMSIIEIKLNALNDPLAKEIKDNNPALAETYNEIQKLLVYWKVDMPSRLGVLISYQDNDGD